MNFDDVLAPDEPPELAVLDVAGTIVGVNDQWIRFARDNGAVDGWTGLGESYLKVCDEAGDPTSLAVARAIRAAARGVLGGWAAIEVACHSPVQKRWFDVVVCPRLRDSGRSIGATVAIMRLRDLDPAAVDDPADRPRGDAERLLDDYPDAVLAMADDGRVVVVNEALCRLFGHPRERLVNLPVEELVPTGSRGMHRRLRAGFTRAPRRRPMGRSSQVLSGRHADGHSFPIRVSLAPARLSGRPVVLAVVRDVSTQSAIDAQGRLVADLLDVTADAIVLHSAADLRPIWVNRTMAELSGWSVEELLDTRPQPLDVLDTDTLRRAAGPLLGGTADAAELRSVLVRRDGRRVPVGVQLTYRERSPGEGYLIVMRRDLTDQERSEAERERLARLEERERIARDLHDSVIQNLFATGLRLSVALEKVSDPVARQRVQDAVTAMDAAVDQLRATIFRIAGPDQVPVRELLEELVETRAGPLGYRPVLLIEGNPDLLPPDVVGELIQVITEALSNTARHAAATRAEIRLAVRRTGDWRLVLRDNGRGFDPADTGRGGNGLANIATRAALLGAALSIRSARGMGTDVQLRRGPARDGPVPP